MKQESRNAETVLKECAFAAVYLRHASRSLENDKMEAPRQASSALVILGLSHEKRREHSKWAPTSSARPLRREPGRGQILGLFNVWRGRDGCVRPNRATRHFGRDYWWTRQASGSLGRY